MRSAAVPRSAVVLLVVLAVATVWLLVLRLGGEADPDAGGPLAPFEGEELARLEIEAGGRTLVLNREPGGWSLGGAVSDLADSARTAGLAAAVCGEFTGPVLPDSEGRIASREYGLDGRGVARLRLVPRDGSGLEMTLGYANPVNGRHYAAGAGRSGVFTVSPELVHRLDALPDAVRLFPLWPAFDLGDVDTVRIARSGGGEPDLFVRQEGDWWLREPAEGTRRIGMVAREYDRLYGDRRRERDGASWWRASGRTLANLLHLLDQTQVREFGPAPAPVETLRAAGLRPPTVAVRLTGADLATEMAADFGGPRGRGGMAATRAGLPNLLVASNEAREYLLAPLAEYVETAALSFAFAAADSFSLATADGLPLRIRRGPEGWEVVRPDAARPAANADAAGVSDADLIADLVYHLEHLQIQVCLPPSPDEEPFAGGYVVTVRCWLPDEPAQELRFGRLDASGTVGLWFPADGRLLRVHRDILNTLRSLGFALEEWSDR